MRRNGDRGLVGGDREILDRGYGFHRTGDRWLPDRWLGMPSQGPVTPPGGGGLADGATINVWPDSSGNGNDGLKTGNPTFKRNIVGGQPVVRLTPASMDGFNLLAAISGAGDNTIFVVMKGNSASVRQWSLGGNASDATPYGPLQNTDGRTYAASRLTAVTGQGTVDAFHVVTSYMRNGIYTTIYKDGVEILVGAGAFTSTGDYATIGYGPSTTPSYSDGDMAEIIFYSFPLALRAKLALLITTLLVTGQFPGEAELEAMAGHRHKIKRYLHHHGAHPTEAQLDAVVEPMAAGDRANIEKTLSVKYGTPAPPSGVVIDPLSVPGMMGWWKADSLLVDQPPFSPLTVPGLKLWLKSEAITPIPDGNQVTLWPDSSAVPNNATAAPATGPVFYNNAFAAIRAAELATPMSAAEKEGIARLVGIPLLQFYTGLFMTLNQPINTSQPWTIVALLFCQIYNGAVSLTVAPSGVDGTRGIYLKSDSDASAYMAYNDGSLQHQSTTNVATTGQWEIVTACNGLYLNGASVPSNAFSLPVGVAPFTTVGSGSFASASSYLAEIQFYNNFVSPANLTKLHNEIKARHGL
jgi:hypothetical protein